MNVPLSSTELDTELESAKATVANIGPIITRVMKEVDAWLEAKDRQSSHESVVMSVHAHRIVDHAAALAERIAGLGTPSDGRVLLMSASCRILDDVLDTNKILETEDAYDETKINTLDDRDIRDAIEFDTELKDMFGLAWIDDEAREPLRDALHLVLDQMDNGVANVPGTVVKALKVLIKGHPRGFGRYYTGTDPWPRPSADIQAEIDAQMPDALDWLRYELKEALEQEAALANSTSGSAMNDEWKSRSVPEVPSEEEKETVAIPGAAEPPGLENFPATYPGDGYIDDADAQVGLSPSSRYLPIEADDAQRRLIESDPTISPDHLDKLKNLKLLLTSDEEKLRVFCGTLGQQSRVILEDLLEVAIGEIEVEHATVVGVVNVMILRVLDICGALRRQEPFPLR